MITGSLVSAIAGSNVAVGMNAYTNLSIEGNLAGDVLAEATGNYAIGMIAGSDPIIGGNLSIGGDLSGKISAEAGGHTAAGLYAGSGIFGANATTPLLISGTVSAKANGVAAGILAVGPMNLQITGIVSGTDTGVNNLGYALRSGSFDGTGRFVESQASADQVTLDGGGTLEGNVDLGKGDDTMTIKRHALISNVMMLDGGDGVDALTFIGWSGTLNTQVANWETILVTGNSTVDLGVNKTIFSSMGTLTMTVNPGSVVYARGSSPGTYTIGGDYNNNGILDMLDDQVNDKVTVTGNYNGFGTLLLDADLSTSGIQNPAEQLIIGGSAGALAGPTTLFINNVVSPVAVTRGKGIRIIDVAGTSSNNAFVLGNPDDFGPFAVDLVKNDGNSWDIVSPGYREEAAVLQSVTPFIERLGSESIPSFQERRAYTWFTDKSDEKNGFWMRTFGSKYRLGMSGDAATKIDGYSGGMQIGTDLVSGGNDGPRGNFGLYGGIGYSEGDVAGLRSDNAGKLTQTAYSVGAYVTVHAPEKSYIEGVLQGSYHDLSLDYLTDPRQNVKLWSYLASVETGLTFQLSECFSLQSKAQVICQQTEGFGLSTRVGAVNIADHDGLQGRLGIRCIAKSCDYEVNPFFEVNLIKDFSESNRVSYLGDLVMLNSKTETLFLGGAIGISRRVSEKNDLDYYLEAKALYGIDDLYSFDYKLIAGIRKNW